MSETEYPVEAVMERYCFYRQKYVMAGKGWIRHMPYRYTSKQVWEHIKGGISLCVFAGPHKTKFLTFDVDMKDEEMVRRVADTLINLGIPEDAINVSLSGNKGYHMDIFFEDSVYNWKAKELYDLVIFMGQFNPRKIEYRPTPKQAIKLPLGIHQATGNRCWFVDLRSMKPIKNYHYIENVKLVSEGLLNDVLEKGNALRFNMLLAEAKAATPQFRKKVATSTDIRIDAPGTRQKRTLEYALLLYRNGADEAGIVDGLHAWMSMQDPTMYKDDPAEISRNIQNIAKWVVGHGERLIETTVKRERKAASSTVARIYRSDIMRVLEAPTKSARMLAFLFTLNCDMYGVCGFGTKRICEELGMSNKTVVTAAQTLVDDMLFDRKPGGYKNMGNRLQAVTNKYTFPEDYRRNGRMVEVDPTDVRMAYARALTTLCDKDELKHRLTATEYKEVIGIDKDKGAAS